MLARVEPQLVRHELPAYALTTDCDSLLCPPPPLQDELQVRLHMSFPRIDDYEAAVPQQDAPMPDAPDSSGTIGA